MHADFWEEEIFNKAAEHYPLNTDTAQWEKVQMKLDQVCRGKRRTEAREKFRMRGYWKRYPVHLAAKEIERSFSQENFTSEGKEYELLGFYKNGYSTHVLISPGWGSHAYVFAELAYYIHQQGYNVFVMPKHGGYNMNQLIKRHGDAIEHIRFHYGGEVHLYGEGLGGFVIFYLALSGDQSIKSITCENSPAILTELSFHKALRNHGAAAKQIGLLLPFLRTISKLIPWMPIPINYFIDWEDFIDRRNESNSQIEGQLVNLYKEDPGFDKKYPLKAIMTMVNSAPPRTIGKQNTAVQFIVAKRGIIPDYFNSLFDQISISNKRLIEIKEAALLITEWIAQQKNQIHEEFWETQPIK